MGVIKDREVKVLDHGFIKVVDTMGEDSAITQAARISYGKGTKSVSEDRGLINYLMRHKHTSPFEMCEIKIHVKLPIFVARQWVRHRTASINEYSLRYSEAPTDYYVPALAQIRSQSTSNKQGRDVLLSEEAAINTQVHIDTWSADAYHYYRTLLEGPQVFDSPHYGVARELARTILPVNYYTEWYWKTNLHNLFHFLRLRKDSHAQHEIKAYADALGDLVEEWVPLAYYAFEEYNMKAVTLSATEAALVKEHLKGLDIQRPETLSKREWAAFTTSFLTAKEGLNET
jgi:thymidylate synthase (FAD)|tara:strand:- start:1812 stop:2672 length:861 start_codon:yes stop_codon:yes gene_type:complete